MTKYGALIIAQKPTRTKALEDGMVDYKHVNPTSFSEKKHSELIKSAEVNVVSVNGNQLEPEKIPN